MVLGSEIWVNFFCLFIILNIFEEILLLMSENKHYLK